MKTIYAYSLLTALLLPGIASASMLKCNSKMNDAANQQYSSGNLSIPLSVEGEQVQATDTSGDYAFVITSDGKLNPAVTLTISKSGNVIYSSAVVAGKDVKFATDDSAANFSLSCSIAE